MNSPPTPAALFGGSFNPPHRSHERIIRACLAQLPVARVLVIPSGRHPLKPQAMPSPSIRLELCRLAFAELPGVAIDDFELQRPQVSYTVDTLRHFARILPAPLYWIIGADNLRQLPLWKDHHEVLRLATVVTYPRLGHPITAATLADLDLTAAEREQLLKHRLEMTADDVASTTIRADVAAGRDTSTTLHPLVAARIQQLGLYRQP